MGVVSFWVVAGLVVCSFALVLWIGVVAVVVGVFVVVGVSVVVVVNRSGDISVMVGGGLVVCVPWHVFPSSFKVMLRGHAQDVVRSLPFRLANKHK